ncbi:hypothetical protein G7085_01125 [Tessaracoccus sp. HDW20]|uniref:hypothetical protein n=1 Tax=Tessaracoccus coleopterorum TaxID=2714950 RepID=UPI0018D4B773|nr:hypothetical protein [Tessaracoccus coleopterorum]NHB83774.1 hypothetical protein [Tessaracoccus coleopterorum]
MTGPSAAVRSAVSVHQGLSDLQTLIAYLDSEVARGELDDAQSADVRALAAAASDALSAAGASLVGGDVKVGVPDLAFPGTTARVDVTLAVNGTWPLSQVAATLTSAEGWVVTPVARPAGPSNRAPRRASRSTCRFRTTSCPAATTSVGPPATATTEPPCRSHSPRRSL